MKKIIKAKNTKTKKLRLASLFQRNSIKKMHNRFNNQSFTILTTF